MFQTLIDKFSDWLLPILLGLAVWYGIHYAVLAPRIVRVDMVREYVYDKSLPKDVNACLKGNMANSVLEVGRLEAALYTSTLKHVFLPFQEKTAEAEKRLDEPCGVSEARRKIHEFQQALLEELKKKQAEERARELARKQQELKLKAQREYQKQVHNQIRFWTNLLFGD